MSPVCRICGGTLPTAELRRAPKGLRCKDKFACVERKAKQFEKSLIEKAQTEKAQA